MLDRRDYLLRQIQQLIDAIVQLFTSIQMEEKKYDPEYINDLYIKYLKQNREFFLKQSIDDIIIFLSKETSPKNAIAKIEVLAELLFGEGKMLNDKKLLHKAYNLYKHAVAKSDVFDINKIKRLDEMKACL